MSNDVHTDKAFDEQFEPETDDNGAIEFTGTFRDSLAGLINLHSRENASNTPDFILAEFLLGALEAFENATNAREAWYGRPVDASPSEILTMQTPAPTFAGINQALRENIVTPNAAAREALRKAGIDLDALDLEKTELDWLLRGSAIVDSHVATVTPFADLLDMANHLARTQSRTYSANRRLDAIEEALLFGGDLSALLGADHVKMLKLRIDRRKQSLNDPDPDPDPDPEFDDTQAPEILHLQYQKILESTEAQHGDDLLSTMSRPESWGETDALRIRTLIAFGAALQVRSLAQAKQITALSDRISTEYEKRTADEKAIVQMRDDLEVLRKTVNTIAAGRIPDDLVAYKRAIDLVSRFVDTADNKQKVDAHLYREALDWLSRNDPTFWDSRSKKPDNVDDTEPGEHHTSIESFTGVARRRGWDAFYDGKKQSENPYGDSRAPEWNDGWIAAHQAAVRALKT